MERYLIFALVALVGFGSAGAVGYARGHRAAAKDCALARAASVERATEQARSIALQDAEVSAGFEVTRTRIQTVYRDKAVEVVHEIPQDCSQCSLSPAGLKLLNDALSGQPGSPPADPGKPDQSVRPAKPPALWHFPGGGHEIGGVDRKAL